MRKPAEIERVREGVTERHCLGCGNWKPRAEFNRKGPFWRSRCRDCEHAYFAAWRERRAANAAR